MGPTANILHLAAILEYSGRRRAVACYIGASTNQRAEMIAAAFALESLKEPCRVILRTDSQYVVETMNGTFKRKSNLELWDKRDGTKGVSRKLTTNSFQFVTKPNGDGAAATPAKAESAATEAAPGGDLTDDDVPF